MPDDIPIGDSQFFWLKALANAVILPTQYCNNNIDIDNVINFYFGFNFHDQFF